MNLCACAPVVVGTLLASCSPVRAAEPDFADFDRRARAGGRLNVVFFGASLTWGSNATDPLLTSYRAVVANRLEEAYPAAHFRFHDAAIGGTTSQLGIFRLERDVLRRRPDLVFLDFSANDDIYSATPETLASYEAIVRRLVGEAKCPVVQVLFPFKWNVAGGSTGGMKRRDAHLAIAADYRTAAGDAIELAIARTKDGRTTLERIWPHDGVHPGDEGYVLFADAAWDAFRKAVDAKQVCTVPETMRHADTYLTTARVRLSSLGDLPGGWTVGRPHLTGAFFDFTMSRWLDDVATAANRTGRPPVPQRVEPLRLRVRATSVFLFGETTVNSAKYRVLIDGEPVRHVPHGAKEPTDLFDAGMLGRRIGGNGHHAQHIASGLDPNVEHHLTIEPVFDGDAAQELRIESVCVAGGPAEVRRGK